MTELATLDRQVAAHRLDLPLPEATKAALASSIYAEIRSIDEATHNQLRNEIAIAPEIYLEELAAFQAWMDLAHSNAGNPVVARAQVVTQLYICFVWLRDSLLEPLTRSVPSGATTAVVQFLSTDERRRLRNAVAHGRWRYSTDYSGLECWDGKPLTRFTVPNAQLAAWQTLSRATLIASLLALTSRDSPSLRETE